jgi:outer membrane biosynthesis protein TonB
MTEVSVTFQGPNWFHVRTQMYEALGLAQPAQPSTASDFPDYEEGFDAGMQMRELIPEPEPAPAAPRSHKKKSAAASPSVSEPAPKPKPEPEPVPEPEPEPEPAKAARDLPSVDALKSIVTQAVRLAQKKSGPTKILELLPEFKAKTGLSFVMDAKDVHRAALADLIEAAGLVEGTA